MMNPSKPIPLQVFEDCQTFSRQLFEKYPSIEAMLFTVDWGLEKNDFPVGTLLTKNPVTLNIIVSLMRQLGKQEQRLLQVVIDQVITQQAENQKSEQQD